MGLRLSKMLKTIEQMFMFGKIQFFYHIWLVFGVSKTSSHNPTSSLTPFFPLSCFSSLHTQAADLSEWILVVSNVNKSNESVLEGREQSFLTDFWLESFFE